MSSRGGHVLAAARRCETIATAVGLSRATGVRFVRHVLDAFPAAGVGPDAELAWRQRACLLVQAFHGRLPAPGYDAVLRSSFERGAVAALHETLAAAAEASAPQAAAELVAVAPGTPVMDVSATAQVGFTSGIQRVVRSLAHHLPEVTPGTTFVRWDGRTRGFVPLSTDEAAAVRSPPPRSAATDVSGRSPGLWGAIRQAATWPRRRLERTLRRRRRLALERGLCQPTVFLWRQPLILPELVADAVHLDAIRLVAEATPVRTTLVFYDALPVRRAELFPAHAHSVYLRSLGLLRHVDAVSCISHTVREHLESLLEVLPRRGPRPAVGVHHLGADFPGATAAETSAYDRPLVLCVGTIEPRKNHLRVLRAMVAAQAAGTRFTGVFAGNAGWLDGPFRTEFAAAVAAGHSLELREQASDGQLHSLYQQAAFTVYCSLDEGLGLPIIESLRHGRPCITSDLGSMREVADLTGGCLLVDPEDASAIAAAIGRLASDTRMLERLAGEAAAASWPSWRDYAEELARFARAPATATLRRAA